MARFPTLEYAELVGDVLLRGGSLADLGELEVALFIADPGDSSTPAADSEVAAAEYERETLAFGSPTAGLYENSSEPVWPEALESWGAVGWLGLASVATGDFIGYIAITPRTIIVGESATILAGDVAVQF